MRIIISNKRMIVPSLVLIIMVLPTGFMPVSHAEDSAPYGDYCKMYSHYGSHKGMHSHKHAEKALRHYFRQKSLEIQVISREERFVKAHVIKRKAVIDTILFDRRTGRIRSIY